MSPFVHQAEDNRYEAVADEQVVGTLDYSLAGKTMIIRHTETVQDHRGQGIARRLTRFALDDARRRGFVVRPECPYAQKFVEQHPEYSDVL